MDIEETEAAVAPAVTPAPPAPAPAAESTPQTDRTYTAAEYRQVVNEAKNLRARLREVESTHNGVAAEVDQLRASLAGIHDEVRGYRLRDALRELSRDEAYSGLDVELVAQLVKAEFGDDGKPKGLNAAVKALIERHPNLRTGNPVSTTPPTPRIPVQPAASGAPPKPATKDAIIEAKRRSGEYLPI